MEAGPDGRLYLLEYGTGWFQKNADAGLSRIDYNPIATAAAPAAAVVDTSASAHGPFAAGYALTQVMDCKSCHKEDGISIGPSFKRVAEKYAGDKKCIRLPESENHERRKRRMGRCGDVCSS